MIDGTAGGVPRGYERIALAHAVAVALTDVAQDVRAAAASTTLYDWAASQHATETLSGRGPAYAAPLPISGISVVVRHARHGGALAPITGDLFLPPTRAPGELAIALALADRGIRTAEVLAYAVYPAGPVFRRSDVVTRRISGGTDLAIVLTSLGTRASRGAALDAAAALLGAMAQAGVQHPDLNLKNILIAPSSDGLAAYLLDVDRVHLDVARAAAWMRNRRRLEQSIARWHIRYGLTLSEEELTRLFGRAAGGS